MTLDSTGGTVPNDDVRIAKTLTGKYHVHYACPHCKEVLKNPIEQAGQTDHCPNCHRGFTVPGKEMVDELLKKIDDRKRQADAARMDKEKRQAKREMKRETVTQSDPDSISVSPVQQSQPESSQTTTPPFYPTRSSPGYAGQVDTFHRTRFEVFLQLGAAIEFVLTKAWAFWMIFYFGTGIRFQSGNAIGATANTLELGFVVFVAWMNAIFVAFIFVYVKLRQIARIQAAK